MYIPVTFFGTQGNCITATASSISGSGTITTGSFVSGGFLWDWYQFGMTNKEDATLTSFTASLNVTSGYTNKAKILIVGGGGTGGSTGSLTLGGTPYSVTTAGGGGGGGVVYYDQFPIAPGNYEIGVGRATLGPGGFRSDGAITSGFHAGLLGQPSWLKLPNNANYTPFTSSYLIGFGGGGSSIQLFRTTGIPPVMTILGFSGQAATSSLLLGDLQNGSGGGGCNVESSTSQGGTPGSNGGAAAGGVDLGGLDGRDQGTRGGIALGGARIDGFCINGVGVGGGGAAVSGSDKQTVSGGENQSPGGNGVLFNLTGTPTRYGAGGGGKGLPGSTGATGRGLGDFGCGGNGAGTPSGLLNGQAGVVIIAIPRCEAAFTCREFAITGSGTTATFLECGNGFTSSVALASGFDIVACLKTFSGSITPVVATGATYVALSQSCDTAFTSSNDGCVNCNEYRVTSDTNKIAKVDYTPCNETTQTTTYLTGTYDLCVSGSDISVATGSVINLNLACSVIGCDTTPSNDNTPPCPCQSLFVNVFSGVYQFDYTDCDGVTRRGSSSSFPFCGVPGSIRNGSCAVGSCLGLTIRQTGECCTYP
jgi:hypothetical protein